MKTDETASATARDHGARSRGDARGSFASSLDQARRDAIAANLCARIGDERHDIDDLLIVDRVLGLLLETERPLAALLSRFRNDRYDEGQGDAVERAWRRAHNAAMDHALSIVLLELATKPPVARSPRADEHRRQLNDALRELAGADVIDLRLKNALTSGAAR